MSAQKRSLAGISSSEATAKGETDNSKKIRGQFLVSHRQGPFLIHVTGDCDPKAKGCNNSFDNLVDQGFIPCPKCMK